MSKVLTREVLKNYFRTGAYPTQEQFGALIDSLRHKDELLQQGEVSQLAESLAGKYDRSEGQALERKVGAPIYCFDKVLFDATPASVSPGAAGCSGGEVVLFLNADLSVQCVCVCNEAASGWERLPRSGALLIDGPRWTAPDCVELYAKPAGAGGVQNSANYILRRRALFVAVGAQSVNSTNGAPEDFAAAYVTDDAGNLMPLRASASGSDEVEELKELIIRLHATITVGVSPATIYKGRSSTVKITKTVKFDGKDLSCDEVLVNGAALKDSYTVNDKTTFTVKIKINNEEPKIKMEVERLATVNAYYPVYYGFGATAQEVVSADVKLSATSSARTTYTATNSKGKDCYFFILVPTGVTAPTAFSMGGAPAALGETSETVNGISYKVFKTGGVYPSGTELKITAS